MPRITWWRPSHFLRRILALPRPSPGRFALKLHRFAQVCPRFAHRFAKVCPRFAQVGPRFRPGGLAARSRANHSNWTIVRILARLCRGLRAWRVPTPARIARRIQVVQVLPKSMSAGPSITAGWPAYHELRRNTVCLSCKEPPAAHSPPRPGLSPLFPIPSSPLATLPAGPQGPAFPPLF